MIPCPTAEKTLRESWTFRKGLQEGGGIEGIAALVEKCCWDTCPRGRCSFGEPRGYSSLPRAVGAVSAPSDTSPEPKVSELSRSVTGAPLLANPGGRSGGRCARAGRNRPTVTHRSGTESPPAPPEYTRAEFMFYSAVEMRTRLCMRI